MAAFAGPIGIRPQPSRPPFVAGHHLDVPRHKFLPMGPQAVAPIMPKTRGPFLINTPYAANGSYGEISCNPYAYIKGKVPGDRMEMSKPPSQRDSNFRLFNQKYGHIGHM